MEWRFQRAADRYGMASGSDSEAVLSLAFLGWLNGADVNEIDDPAGLAGFLSRHSDLTRRELAGLLGTFEFPAPESRTALEFEYAGETVRVERVATDTEAFAAESS